MKPECEKRLAVVIGGVRDHGARRATCASTRRPSGRRVGVRSTSVARLHSRALPGMEGRAGRENGRTVVAPKGERIACGRMSPRRPRSESNCGASAGVRRGLAGASDASQGKTLWRDATRCHTCVVANPRRVHVDNYVKRLVLKHEPRSLAPLRAFGWRKPDSRENA